MAKKRRLSQEEILHLARLARLKLKSKEIKKFQEQLTETLDYISNLGRLNTDNVSPTNQSISLGNIFFDDGEKNKRGLTVPEALGNLKKKTDNYFMTEKIF